MSGLQRLLKLYGRIEVRSEGRSVWCRWDYAKDEARLESEMSNDEIKASEKAKYELIKKHHTNDKQENTGA